MKTKRVGSVTCGLTFLSFGILLLLHSLFQMISLNLIFKLWPLILISIGIEMLISTLHSKKEEFKFIYDTGAIILLFTLTFFSVGMGLLELIIRHSEYVLY